jgi:hypothetical protein
MLPRLVENVPPDSADASIEFRPVGLNIHRMIVGGSTYLAARIALADDHRDSQRLVPCFEVVWAIGAPIVGPTELSALPHDFAKAPSSSSLRIISVSCRSRLLWKYCTGQPERSKWDSSHERAHSRTSDSGPTGRCFAVPARGLHVEDGRVSTRAAHMADGQSPGVGRTAGKAQGSYDCPFNEPGALEMDSFSCARNAAMEGASLPSCP